MRDGLEVLYCGANGRGCFVLVGGELYGRVSERRRGFLAADRHWMAIYFAMLCTLENAEDGRKAGGDDECDDEDEDEDENRDEAGV